MAGESVGKLEGSACSNDIVFVILPLTNMQIRDACKSSGVSHCLVILTNKGLAFLGDRSKNRKETTVTRNTVLFKNRKGL